MNREGQAQNTPNHHLVCYLAQQCAEKYLKARLQEANLAFPKTHNLPALLALIILVEPSCVEGVQAGADGPGFRKIIIRPAVVGGLTWARASYDSRSGRIVGGWKRDGRRLTLSVTLPANTTATVYVPARDPRSVLEGGLPISPKRGVRFLRSVGGTNVYLVGSGEYLFSSQ